MTDFVPYEPGTIQVTNGSKNIVGTGTDFSAYSDGDTIWVDGYPVLLDGDPSSDTAALAKYNYLGTSGSGKSYRWVPLGDLSRAIALDTRLSSYFTSGNLSAEAGLTGAADVISYYTGVGTKAVTAFTAAARTVLDDTTVAAMRTTLFDVSTTVDNRIARYDGTAGALQNSAITVDDSGNVSDVGTLAVGAISTTGNLTITKATPVLALNKSASGQENQIFGRLAGIDHWVLLLGNADAVTGSGNAGDNFELKRRTDAGVGLGSPLIITRSSGLITIEGQIAMPATQNASAGANTWDDYEQGTATWTTAFGGASVGVVYGGQTLNYDKNGRYVHVAGNPYISSKGSSTGAATSGGMPFTSTGYSGPCVAPAATAFSSLTAGFTGYVGGTTITYLVFGTTGAAENLTDANFANHANFMVSADYPASA